MKEFVFAGLLMSPFVRYAILAGVCLFFIRRLLVWVRFYRWFWHPLLAEAAIYVCLVAVLNLFI